MTLYSEFVDSGFAQASRILNNTLRWRMGMSSVALTTGQGTEKCGVAPDLGDFRVTMRIHESRF